MRRVEPLGKRSSNPPSEALSCVYDLVPLHELPRVDLTVSVKAKLIRNKSLHRVIRVITTSPLTFVGGIACNVLAIAAFILPAHAGRIVATVSFISGLPGILIALTMLRYDLVWLLLKTYDVCFFGLTATVVAFALVALLRDARALLAVTLWLSVVAAIVPDANLFAVRQIKIASMFATVWYTVIAGAVSIGITPEMHLFNVVSAKNHELPATVVVRDGMQVLTLLVLRNIYRLSRLHETTQTATCVSFRCRLQLRLLDSVCPSMNLIPSADQRTRAASGLTTLQFMPQLEPVRTDDIILPVVWRFIGRSDQPSHSRRARAMRFLFCVVGVVGFVISNTLVAAIGLAPAVVQQPSMLTIATLGLVTSVIFTTISLAASNRRLLYGIFSTFDGVFVLSQCTLIHVVLVELSWREVTTMRSLCSMWLWAIYLCSWDAITPPVRRLLGLSSRSTVWLAIALIAVLVVNGVAFVMFLPPQALNDRVVGDTTIFGHRVEYRLLPWYVSCAANLATWSVRLIWRLWHVRDGELVQFDGVVTFDIPRRRTGQPSEASRGVGPRLLVNPVQTAPCEQTGAVASK